MIPRLIEIPVPLIGSLPINSFGLMIALALLAAIQVMATNFKRSGLNPLLADRYVLVAGFVGLFGARIWYILGHFDEARDDLAGALLATAGFTFYGGFIVAALAVIIMARRDHIPVAIVADCFAPCLALGYAIGRVGCQLAGDGDYGIEAAQTALGMSYSQGIVPTAPGVAVYPTPLYESAASLVILFIIIRLSSLPAWQRPLRCFGAYLLLIAAERFLVEFIRIEPRVLGAFSEAQLIAVVMMFIGAYIIWARRPVSAP